MSFINFFTLFCCHCHFTQIKRNLFTLYLHLINDNDTVFSNLGLSLLRLLALRIQYYVKAPLECASVSWAAAGLHTDLGAFFFYSLPISQSLEWMRSICEVPRPGLSTEVCGIEVWIFRDLSWNCSSVVSSVCFGLLCSCKVNHPLSLRSLHPDIELSSKDRHFTGLLSVLASFLSLFLRMLPLAYLTVRMVLADEV